MRKLPLIAGLAIVAACSDATSPNLTGNPSLKPSSVLAAGNATVVVTETDVTRQIEDSNPTDSWVLYTRPSADVESGDFVSGPATPPLGSGSFHTVTATTGSKVFLYNYDHAGTKLTDIDGISYYTFKPSTSAGVAFPSLNIQIDINGGTLNAGEFRTLVFEPYMQPGFVNTTETWQPWDAFNAGNAKWWSTGVTLCPQGTPCTWSGILANYPDATLLGFGINQGSGNSGVDGSVDAIRIAYGGNSVTYNFEPVLGSCSVSVSGTTITLLANCTTDHTLQVPNGFTLDGDGYTITAVDPSAGHFLGAVVKNAGSTAHVTNLTVTTSALANACDGGADRLRGIMLEGAAGSITNNVVTGIRQGVASGCQEGNAIEVRNAPFDNTGTDLLVTISGNVVTDFQKTGILANGSVSATITGNSITGAGPVNYIAQNGIQIGFGATALVKNNTSSGNNYTGADVACGILLYQADGVKASTNYLFNNEKDMCNYGKGGGNVKASN